MGTLVIRSIKQSSEFHTRSTFYANCFLFTPNFCYDIFGPQTQRNLPRRKVYDKKNRMSKIEN